MASARLVTPSFWKIAENCCLAKTPELVIPYYDPRTKSYKSAKTGGTPLKYGIIQR